MDSGTPGGEVLDDGRGELQEAVNGTTLLLFARIRILRYVFPTSAIILADLESKEKERMEGREGGKGHNNPRY